MHIALEPQEIFRLVETVNVKSGPPGIWAWLYSLLPVTVGVSWTLCRTGSEFFTTIFWPVWTAVT